MNNSIKENYTTVVNNISQKLEKEIHSSIAKTGCCDFYIAMLDTASRTEIFANNTRLFLGPENICKKIYKDIVQRLENSPYYLDGDISDQIVYIRRA